RSASSDDRRPRRPSGAHARPRSPSLTWPGACRRKRSDGKGATMTRLVVAAAMLAVLGVATPGAGADWTPRAWANESTLQLRTTAADEGEHWFPVWLVVIDDQLYVRLGSRAAGRIERNTTAPWVGVRVGGREFA